MINNRKGFTLIEIVLVIGILSILFTIALVAINPSRQFSLANNTKRQSNIEAILNGINQYMVDHKGAIPTGITGTSQIIRKTGGADLCALLVPTYLGALPIDPSIGNGKDVTDCTTSYNTNYTVVVGGTDNRITLTAPGAELGQTITITR